MYLLIYMLCPLSKLWRASQFMYKTLWSAYLDLGNTIKEDLRIWWERWCCYLVVLLLLQYLYNYILALARSFSAAQYCYDVCVWPQSFHSLLLYDLQCWKALKYCYYHEIYRSEVLKLMKCFSRKRPKSRRHIIRYVWWSDYQEFAQHENEVQHYLQQRQKIIDKTLTWFSEMVALIMNLLFLAGFL
jgi:hypothetical protein